MRLQDLHTHSLFDDGKNSLEEMVQAAIGKGLSAIGLSGHSPIENEREWTMPKERLSEYLLEVKRLKEAYRDQIAVFCGIEYDMRSELELSQFDYVIGSLHATVTPDGTFDADNTPQIAQEGIARYFGCDSDMAAKCYFSQYAAMAQIPEIDIVGHFDLLTKYNEKVKIYNPDSSIYLNSAFEAMEVLVRAEKIFEINTGAISRGYRTGPYPAKKLLSHLRALNGRICLNSDSHSAKAIGCAFEQSLELAKECGFTELWLLTEQGFMPMSISELQL